MSAAADKRSRVNVAKHRFFVLASDDIFSKNSLSLLCNGGVAARRERAYLPPTNY